MSYHQVMDGILHGIGMTHGIGIHGGRRGHGRGAGAHPGRGGRHGLGPGAGDPHGPGVIPVGAGDRRGDIPAGEVVWHGVLPTMLPTVAVPGKAYVTDTPVSPIIHVQALAEPMGTIEFLLAR